MEPRSERLGLPVGNVTAFRLTEESHRVGNLYAEGAIHWFAPQGCGLPVQSRFYAEGWNGPYVELRPLGSPCLEAGVVLK